MRRLYGSGPAHLVGHVALFAVLAIVVVFMLPERAPVNALLWFAAAVLVHDGLVLPMYASADRALKLTLGRAVNYVRVPAALSLLLLLVYFPLILDRPQVGANFARNAAYRPEGYLGRYLAVVAALFALSGIAYAVRGRRRRAQEADQGAGGW